MVVVYYLGDSSEDFSQVNEITVYTDLRLLNLTYSAEVLRGCVFDDDLEELFHAFRLDRLEEHPDIYSLVWGELLVERLQRHHVATKCLKLSQVI